MRAGFAAACLCLATLLAAACGSPPAAGTLATPRATATAAPSPSASASPAAPAPARGATASVMEMNAPGMGGAFSPASITIHAGESVEFVNRSGNIHNVTFADMRSPIMYGGDKWTATFPRAGSYKYVCTFHPGMEGVIVVS